MEEVYVCFGPHKRVVTIMFIGEYGIINMAGYDSRDTCSLFHILLIKANLLPHVAPAPCALPATRW